MKTKNSGAMIYVKTVNGDNPEQAKHQARYGDYALLQRQGLRLKRRRTNFHKNYRYNRPNRKRGDGGMIVAPPRWEKQYFDTDGQRRYKNHPDVNLIMLLIDRRPEEVTDIQRSIEGENVRNCIFHVRRTAEHHKG